MNPLVILRGARRDDAMELLDLDIKCFDTPWTAEDWASTIQNGAMSVATVFGNIAGFIVLRPTGEITKLAVKSVHRRKGITYQLLDDAVFYGRQQGALMLSIIVPESAIYPGPCNLSEWLTKLKFKPVTPFLPDYFTSYGENESGVKFIREL